MKKFFMCPVCQMVIHTSIATLHAQHTHNGLHYLMFPIPPPKPKKGIKDARSKRE